MKASLSLEPTTQGHIKQVLLKVAIIHFSVFTCFCGYKLMPTLAILFNGHWQGTEAQRQVGSSHDRPEC